MSPCPVCGGSAGVFLGRLGTVVWFSCRDCGCETCEPVEDDEDTEREPG